MRHYLANIWLIIIISTLFVGVSLIASLISCEWHWFGRSGAILTMAGVLLGVRPLVRMGLAEWLKDQSTINGGRFKPTEDELEADRQAKLDSRATQIGVILAVVGTLIWAYGDLIGGLP